MSHEQNLNDTIYHDAIMSHEQDLNDSIKWQMYES